MRRRRFPIAGAALALLLAASPADAQVAVFDAGNYAQNLLQAARALDQIQNQVAALQNQARMLINQQLNLQTLGYSVAPALQADMGRVNALLSQAGRVANDAASIRQAMQQDYSGQGSDADLAAAADARWRNSLDAFQHVLEVQAAVAEDLPSTQGEAGDLLQAGQGATGALQAAQAGDQLMAVQAKELADLTAVITAQSRAEALDASSRAAAAAEARTRLQRFLGDAP